MPTDLSLYNNSWYRPGSKFKILSWMIVSTLFFRHSLAAFNKLKIILLKAFGAKIGRGVVIKPSVIIKYPWLLEIGNHTWIGEKVWIDNLAKVQIGSNVCISQGAYLLTGNHDYKSNKFSLKINPVVIQDGVWIGAKAVVCPGVVCGHHSVLNVMSVATSNMEPSLIYQGNPAVAFRERVFNS
jgi:putative colanic acid biosynthesis acetyltransferase WcaF